MKKKILIISLLTLFVAIAFATNIHVIYAMETSVSTSNSTVEPNLNELGKNIWENKILPFVASISLGSVVSVCLSYFFAHGNKKTIGNFVDTSTNEIKLYSTLVKTVMDLFTQNEVSNAINKTLMDNLFNELKSIKTNLEKLPKEFARLDSVKSTLDNLVTIEVMVANNTKNLVTSGVAEKINELVIKK